MLAKQLPFLNYDSNQRSLTVVTSDGQTCCVSHDCYFLMDNGQLEKVTNIKPGSILANKMFVKAVIPSGVKPMFYTHYENLTHVDNFILALWKR